jgi:hypothetical protein
MATRRALHPSIDQAIETYAKQHGLDPQMVRTFVHIESGGQPTARTGQYKGLLQLSDSEFKKYGGGDIYSVDDNLRAGIAKLRAESDAFTKRTGRPAAANDLYMIHQQGEGGSAAHFANPDKPAWENMYSTREGREKGPGWAKLAIWGNVPDDLKAKYGSVENMTSRDFTDMWANKVASFGGGQPAAPPKPPVWTGEGDSVETPVPGINVPARTYVPPPEPVASPGGPLDGLLATLFPDQQPQQAQEQAQKKEETFAAATPQGGVEIRPVPQRPLDLTKLRAMLANRRPLGTGASYG